jgi:CRP-like cAMP-binding protein
MLQDVRKMVGMKTGEELEAIRYEQRLHGTPKAAAAQYFELGGMHRKTGNKKAAIDAFLHAANLAADGKDLTIAMAANKAIVQMEPEHKDALANLAYIRFQYGTDVVNKEYGELLRELDERRRTGQHLLTTEPGEKKVSSNPYFPDDVDPAFEIERQAAIESAVENLESSGNLENGRSGHVAPSDEHSGAPHEQSTSGANNRLNAFSDQVCEKKSLTPRQGKTRLWGKDRRNGTTQTHSQKKERAFEANRKSLIDLIEGKNEADFSASFELERQALVSLIGQSDDDSSDTAQQSSESPIYLGTQAEETATNTSEPVVHLEEDPSSETPDMPESPDDDWTEPDEIIDLRKAVEHEAEMIRTHLHRCVAFSALSDSEFEELADHVQLHELTEDSVIFDPNGTNRSLFVVFDGEVELAIKSETRELARLHMVTGDFFGEHTFWKEHSMAVSANASTACTLAEIPAATFLSFARRHPVMLQFLKRVCKRRYFAAMLAQTHVFQDCSMKDRQTIAEYLSPVHVSEGVAILPEGECARDLYIIQSGEVNVFTTFVEENGESPIIQDAHERISLDHLREGDVFGEETFFTNEPCVTTFWARTDILLLKLSGDCLSTFVELLPQFGGRLYELHQQRTQLTMRAVESVLAG